MAEAGTAGILNSLLIGACVLSSIFVIFDILRHFFPGLIYYREAAAREPFWNNYDNTPMYALPRPPSIPLAWIRPTLLYSEEDAVRTHGLDVAMYLRFLSTQAKLFATLTVFTGVVLYPTYVTGPNRFRPPGDPLRVEGIEIISLANVGEKSSRLWITLVSEIAVVAIILFFLYSDIVKYTEYRRCYRADPWRNPSNYAIIIQDIPSDCCTNASVFKLCDSVFPGEVTAVRLIRNAERLYDLKSKYIAAVTKRERAEWNRKKHAASQIADPDPETPTAYVSSTSESTFADINALDSNISLHRREQEKLRAEIEEQERNLDEHAPLTQSAIVVFSSLKSATFASNSPIWSSANEWRISRAAEPRAVNWNRMDIKSWTTRMRTYVSFLSLTALAVFWTVPSGFIQALGNFGELAEKYPNSFLVELEAWNPRLIAFLEGTLPPLLLFLALLLVPIIIRFVVSFERIHNLILVESKIRNFLFLFYVMSNFVYVVVIGSVFTQFKAILDNPSSIVSLLSTSVPGQATFLMKYVLINAFLGSALGMLNIPRLLVRPFLMSRARTRREIRKADSVFSFYPYAQTYALSAMFSLIGLVYSTIAPVICVVALLYYSIAYLCTKHFLLYSHRPLFEGGGYLFRDAWVNLLVGLYCHQLSMIGIFSLKRAAPQASLATTSFIFSVWFTLYCRQMFFRRIKHGALADPSGLQEDGKLRDGIPLHFPDLYIHPGLLPLEKLEMLQRGEDL